MKSRFSGRRGVFSGLVCVLALLLCVSFAWAQSAGTGALTGTVTDAQGGAVAGVTVTATNIGTNQARSATTGAGWRLQIQLAPAGQL